MGMFLFVLGVMNVPVAGLGRMICIDGLLFSRTDDHKAETFAKSLKSHSTKLSALELLPLLLGNIASIDPRYQTEARFVQAVAIIVDPDFQTIN